MKKLFLLLLMCHVSSPVKHSLKYYYTGTTGTSNCPQMMSLAEIDGLQLGYCDTDRKKLESKYEWVQTFFNSDPQQLEHYTRQCFENGPNYFKATIQSVMQVYNQTGGVHVLQRLNGVEWDDETGEITGFNHYGYDGEDFLSFDPKTMTWIAQQPEALSFKLKWDVDKDRSTYNELFLTQVFPGFLKKYVAFGKSFLQRTELPSVSLLQKTPSSPISCHATGFYPGRAVMMWRKDGDELHEHVEYGEILPNHDETFQMSVDLNVSSVRAEDWRRYDCVFQLSGVKDDIVTRLDKAAIRSNWEKPSDMTIPIAAAVVVLALVLIAAAGFMVYRRKKGERSKAKRPPSSPDGGFELSEELNPDK